MQYDHILFSNTCLIGEKRTGTEIATKIKQLKEPLEKLHNEYQFLETETGQKSEILNPVKH